MCKLCIKTESVHMYNVMYVHTQERMIKHVLLTHKRKILAVVEYCDKKLSDCWSLLRGRRESLGTRLHLLPLLLRELWRHVG